MKHKHVNGVQYTTATQDMQIKELMHDYIQTLQQELDRAIKTSSHGQVKVNLQALGYYLEQAYYLGRTHGEG